MHSGVHLGDAAERKVAVQSVDRVLSCVRSSMVRMLELLQRRGLQKAALLQQCNMQAAADSR